MVRAKSPTGRPKKRVYGERKRGEEGEDIIGYRSMYKGFLHQELEFATSNSLKTKVPETVCS